MTRKIILGISAAAIFAISMTFSSALADISGSMTVTAASSDGVTHTMTVVDMVKEIPADKAPGLITFWAWAIPTPSDAPIGTALTVDAITIHHGVNDHQAFDDGADQNPTNKNIKSSPVQSFHPHKAFFDSAFCVIGLQSPKSSFAIKDNTLSLQSSDTAFAVATGTIGSRSECASGLGITGLVTAPTPIP